jgi:hypothetical protein
LFLHLAYFIVSFFRICAWVCFWNWHVRQLFWWNLSFKNSTYVLRTFHSVNLKYFLRSFPFSIQSMIRMQTLQCMYMIALTIKAHTHVRLHVKQMIMCKKSFK